MRGFLASLIGDEKSGSYDADRYQLYGFQKVYGDAPAPAADAPTSEPPLPPPRQLPAPLVEDAGQQTGGLGSPEPVQFGCWALPQPAKVPTGGNQQIVWDRSATAAKAQIAAQEAPTGHGSTLAPYDDRTWRTPFEVSQDVVVTGALINTYTGEVTETYENAMPPPDREAGDLERQWKTADLRLQAAQGYEPRKLQKKEIEDPLPPADSGPIMANASFRQMQSVALESNERCSRDHYFNRDELVPTEPIMTSNPMGFRGFQNMLRINPYLPVTQELDNKDWAPNSEPIPTTARFLETRIRLHRDALAGRTGLAEGPFEDEHVRPKVRVTQTQRNTECKQGPRGALASAPLPAAATAEAVARTLRGLRAAESTRGNDPLYSAQRPDAAQTERGGREHRPEADGAGHASIHAGLGIVGADPLGVVETQGPVKQERTYGDGRRGQQAPFAAQSAWSSSEATTTKRRDAVPRRSRPSAEVEGSRPLVASAEECRRTLLPLITTPRGGGQTPLEGIASTAQVSSAEAPLRLEKVHSKSLMQQVHAGLEAPVSSVGETTLKHTDRGDGLAGSREVPDVGRVEAMGAPVGSKTLSDLRGIIPNEHQPAFQKVADHQVRRPMAAERPEQAPEMVVGAIGKPDAVTSQRAFIGARSRKERVRGPTPRRGGAERVRTGLARLDGPTSYEEEEG